MLKLDEKFKKTFGEVFTPFELVEEMLSKLPLEVWSNKDLKWVDPACGTGNFLLVVRDRLMKGLENVIVDETEREKWILEEMLHGVDLQERNIILCKLRLDFGHQYKLNVETHDSLTFDFWRMKFDVVVGNPPYQAPQEATGKRGGGDQLWDKFVDLCLDKLVADNGYLCFVHPAVWRKPLSAMWEKMSMLQFLYLEIHDAKDGKKMFNAGTRYDFYVLQNKQCSEPTIVVDEDGHKSTVDFREWPWLPNGEFGLIRKILTINANESAGILFSRGNYGSDREWMSSNQDDGHPYPCVHTTAKSKGVICWWSSVNDKGFFGIPKVIFGDGGTAYPFIDLLGEYGMTQHAMAIPISNEKEAKLVEAAINTPAFQSVMTATKWSNFQIDWRMFKFFKKGWWKEFVSEPPSITEDEN